MFAGNGLEGFFYIVIVIVSQSVSHIDDRLVWAHLLELKYVSSVLW